MLGSLFALVAVGRFPVWPVAIIAVREIAISLYRVYWGRRGLAVPARKSAKLKTLVQSLAVGAVLMPPLTDVTWLADGLLYVGTFLAVLSAAAVRARRQPGGHHHGGPFGPHALTRART